MRLSDPDPTTFPLHAAEERKTTRWRQGTEAPVSVASVLRHDVVSEDTFVERYHSSEMLGRGGMGEVARATDTLIGRNVAVKSLLPIEPGQRQEAVTRFLKEARVQALLEHPAIVPVYDLGFDSEGLPFFTMKQVRGETLYDLMERAPRDAALRTKLTRRMLGAFVTVCRAIHYAHERGVVHRDLKPDNVMVGSHGEVYVLDWGVAKIVQDEGDTSVTDELGLEGDTHPGDMIGTPGYLAPEQALADTDVDTRSDIFALGAVLYELLTLRPLIDGRDRMALVRSVIDPNRVPPSGQDVPPELYALVLHATRFDREERIGSARVLADAVEAFLDGDRDQILRDKLAAEHARLARRLAAEALDGPVHGREAARGEAMREAGRALALVPNHDIAASVVLRLFATPPDPPPAEALREVERLESDHLRGAMRDSSVRTAIWILFLPLVAALGIRIPWLFAVMVALGTSCAALAFVMYRRRIRHKHARLGLYVLVSAFAAMSASVFGPLIFVPGFVAVNALLYSVQASTEHRKPMLALAALAITVPLALELTGVLPPSMSFDGDTVRLLPRLTGFRPAIVLVSLYAVSIVGVIVPSILALRLRDALHDAERKLVLQKWQLSQLAPRLGRDA